MLAQPTQLNINLSSDRFAMFNKQRDITSILGGFCLRSNPLVEYFLLAQGVLYKLTHNLSVNRIKPFGQSVETNHYQPKGKNYKDQGRNIGIHI